MHLKNLRVRRSNFIWDKGFGYIFDYKTEFDHNFLVHFPYIAFTELHHKVCVDEIIIEHDDDLKFDVDLNQVDIGINYDGIDYSQLDFSVGVDTGAVCIAVPHSGFMSQGLVIFKCFSLCVWVLILITVFMYILLQTIFQYLQTEVLHVFYSERELDHYKGTSAILTVYAYFICGCPPSLLLARFCTGKMLFFIFSFSALIIATVFLSGMTTLLSERVLGTEIDSLKMLEESDVFIQTDTLFDVEDIQISFNRQNISEALRERITNSLAFYTSFVIGEIVNTELFLNNLDRMYERSFILKNISGGMIEKMEEVIRSIAARDAFLVHLPIASTPKESIFLRHLLMNEEFEYHLMKEYIMTYPWIIAFKKNSFVFDRLNEIIARYFETGHGRKALEELIPSKVRFDVSSVTVDGKKPRPCNLDDLQSAFISLIVGLFLSFLVFLLELCFDDLQDGSIVKLLWHFKNSILIRIRHCF
ncbi:unnamed protein product [Bemisia tabaci]|uniref:Ionotropic receptor n=1 Tax=Bemisia tabaci TaxID=7038 RepID=A0A9P0EX85_BEMTA|nr:unnamed protein product [Bemisia tabaci]